jgi:hypothetical membrane protein
VDVLNLLFVSFEMDSMTVSREWRRVSNKGVYISILLLCLFVWVSLTKRKDGDG